MEKTADDIIELMRRDLKTLSQNELANRIGVSPSYVSGVLDRSRTVSEKIANYYGYTIKKVYKPK